MTIKQTELLIATGRATARDFAGMAYEDVAQIKAGVPLQLRGMHSKVDIDALGPHGATMLEAVLAQPDVNAERVVPYVMSTEDVDRMGDIIRVFGPGQDMGWQLEEYADNPVFLWSHESWNPPIGTTRAFWRGTIFQNGVEKNALVGLVEYLAEDVNPFAEHIFKMVQLKAIVGSSVGFLPVEVVEYPSAAAREAAGLGEWGVEFTKQVLLEDSQAVVPANPFALATGLKSLVAAGEMTDKEAREFAGTYSLTAKDLREKLATRLRSVVDMGRAKQVSIQRSIRGRASDILKVHAEVGDPVAEILGSANRGLDQGTGGAQDQGDRGAAVITMDAAKHIFTAQIPGQDPIEVPEGHTLSFVDGEFVVKEVAASDPPPDPEPSADPAGTPEPVDQAKMLTSEERAIVRSALGDIFDGLAEMQGSIGRALDQLEERSAPDPDDKTTNPDLAEARALVEKLSGLIQSVESHGKTHPAGLPHGDPSEGATPVPAAFDLKEASSLVRRVADELQPITH